VLPEDRHILKHHELPPGLYLNECLQQLLPAYGFTFSIDYISPTSRKLHIHQANVGAKKQIRHQVAGETLDLALTNADVIRVDYDKSTAINQIRAVGDYSKLEATWELKPAWPAEWDDIPAVQLSHHPFFALAHPEYARVWRDWVLNEDGSYPRAWEGHPAEIPNPDLTNKFVTAFGLGHEVLVAKRRKFHPMLTLGADRHAFGTTGGCHVEWWNPYKLAEAGWEPVMGTMYTFGCRLLTDECGISFTDELPPFMIIAAGQNARVRITATVESDFRISAVAVRLPGDASVNALLNEQIVDVNRHFHLRGLHPESQFAEAVEAGLLLADVNDGREALAEFAVDLRQTFDRAKGAAEVRLEGLDHEDYELGDLITAVTGREIDLALTRAAAGELVYPQVIGIRWEVQSQKMILTLDEFKQTDAYLASLIRRTKKLK
jgi:hypothetical protein